MGRNRNLFEDREYQMKIIENNEVELDETDDELNLYDKKGNVSEKVIKSNYKKVYNYNDINKWIKYGLRNNLINMDDKKSVYDWVSVLQKINFEV